MIFVRVEWNNNTNIEHGLEHSYIDKYCLSVCRRFRRAKRENAPVLRLLLFLLIFVCIFRVLASLSVQNEWAFVVRFREHFCETAFWCRQSKWSG